MKITGKQMEEAVNQGILTREQADRFSDFLASCPEQGHAFNMGNVLYYMGGLTAMGAMTLFMNLGWEKFGGWGIFAISLAYAVAALFLAHYFRQSGHAVASAMCAAFVTVLTPLAVYGLQKATGWWPDHSVYMEYHRIINERWIYMELATLAVGAVMIWIYRHPFLLMPVAVTLWYMSMDTAVMVAGSAAGVDARARASMWFGLVEILAAVWVDMTTRKTKDYAFWLYISGVVAFWGGMMACLSHNEMSRLVAMCINLCLVGAGVIMMRRVFVVFGAIGAVFYAGHLAFMVFRNSWVFPFFLTLIGLGIILAGIFWQKHEQKIAAGARRLLPDGMRNILEDRT